MGSFVAKLATVGLRVGTCDREPEAGACNPVARDSASGEALEQRPLEVRRHPGPRVLDDHCAAVNRDPAEIRRSVGVPFRPDDPERTLRDAEAQIANGFTELLITVKGADPAGQVESAAGLLLDRLRG